MKFDPHCLLIRQCIEQNNYRQKYNNGFRQYIQLLIFGIFDQL
ncbi:unnamed protein product [Paramecium sonneborni]|uniref:Uncharacterized protein n=1 Tax=Paramecium sonneborni TaxID=65129 RepID=A0A8S1RPD8_9CILI|nr:unnamed protein product [Paramecium sonneborni]